MYLATRDRNVADPSKVIDAIEAAIQCADEDAVALAGQPDPGVWIPRDAFATLKEAVRKLG